MTTANQKDPPAPERAPSGGRDMRREDWQDEAWLPERRPEGTEDSMSKREALARAAFAKAEEIRRRAEYEPRNWEEVEQAVRSAHLAIVDAILAELREPDEGMRQVGSWHIGAAMDQLPADDVHEQKFVECWHETIDAITEPPK